ncbi:hypothetical protein ACQ3I4_04425 [Zafaria sp. Z1313]|uniref:hypothetical protein n=1 Tax=Zafaria sp. Z1313 TaxID=3423202 RepID=UPI003D303D20
MTEQDNVSPTSSPEELSRLLVEEVRQRAELRKELLAAYRKQEAQLSRIVVLEELLRHRGVATYFAARVLTALPGRAGKRPASAKNLVKAEGRAAYRKVRRLAGRMARKLGIRK